MPPVQRRSLSQGSAISVSLISTQRSPYSNVHQQRLFLSTISSSNVLTRSQTPQRPAQFSDAGHSCASQYLFSPMWATEGNGKDSGHGEDESPKVDCPRRAMFFPALPSKSRRSLQSKSLTQACTESHTQKNSKIPKTENRPLQKKIHPPYCRDVPMCGLPALAARLPPKCLRICRFSPPPPVYKCGHKFILEVEYLLTDPPSFLHTAAHSRKGQSFNPHHLAPLLLDLSWSTHFLV